MATGINYLDETWSPITGCSGQNCPTKDTCWAKAMVKRFPQIHGYEPESDDGYIRGWGELPFEKVQFHPDRLNNPLHWKKPRRIGVCFMGDLFDEQVLMEWQEAVFIHTYRAPHHKYFFLSKQVLNMQKIVTEWFKYRAFGMPKKLHWGISITSQADADRMIPELLRIPGKHWVSIEPMMGPLSFRLNPLFRALVGIRNQTAQINWIVLGCHNHPSKYPCPHEWMIDVVEQCRAAGVKCWVKQIQIGNKVCTDITKFPKELQVREWPE